MGANMLLCQIFFCATSFITTLGQETANNSLNGMASVSSDTQLVTMSKIFSFGSVMVRWNSIGDSVLISFAHMCHESPGFYFLRDTSTVMVQPEVHWGDTMAAVEPYEVSIIGGRASNIGTGLLLGGGITNSIKEVDVVLVMGKSVTANTTNNFSDLFHALKGGANRYPESSSVALSNASARYIRDVTDPKAGLIVLIKASNLTPADANVLICLFYKGGSPPTNIFGDFLSLPNTSTSLSPLSCYGISSLISGSGRGNSQQFGASSWTGNEATFLNGYNHFMNFTRTFGTDLLAADLIISPIPRSQCQWTANKSRGLNAIGDPGVAYAAINFNLIYPTGLRTTGFYVFLLLTDWQSVLSYPGLPLYINECDASQNVFKTYPRFSALQKMYAKYDSSRFNVRHTAGPIGM
ncbi:FAD-binding domain-containing protein [Mycena olivaceomarginata]|nr:FAD-binding domain-containing protein [Mycena olivaceomarginata]